MSAEMDKRDFEIVMLTTMAAQKAYEGFVQIYGEKWGEKLIALAKGEEDKETQWRMLVTLAVEAADKDMLRLVKKFVSELGSSGNNEYILHILEARGV